MGFNKTLENHKIIHVNSKIVFKPIYPEFGIEFRYIYEDIKELSVSYARVLKQYIFKYQTLFSARFDKQDEDNQVLDETELFIKLKINHNLTASDLEKNDLISPLKNQIQQQEMKDTRWRFYKIKSMTLCFYQTDILNGSNDIQIPLRSSAILRIEKDDKHCFLWIILVYFSPYNNNHPNRVSN